jgi:polyhydroxyalkanoate synthase
MQPAPPFARAGEYPKGCDNSVKAGVGTKDSLSSGRLFFAFALIADLQREYFRQLWQFWNSMFLQTFAGGAHSSVALERGDKRFKDYAWHEMPYYDLLKQSYLLGSKQLHEFVDGAQVDDKTKLQLRFYARHFIDAMSPSNLPATNPENARGSQKQSRAEKFVLS